VQQVFAGVDGGKPVLVQQLADLLTHLALLRVHAQLAPLDPGDEIADGDLQRVGDPGAPILGAAGLGGALLDLGQLG